MSFAIRWRTCLSLEGGCVGNHIAEYYVKKGHDVTVFDNLSKSRLLKKDDKNLSIIGTS